MTFAAIHGIIKGQGIIKTADKKNKERRKRQTNKPKIINNQDAKIIRQRLNDTDRLIFDISVETGLRISDILTIKAREINKIMYIRERKTKKHKIIEFSDKLYMRLIPLRNPNADPSKFAFESLKRPETHINRSTYHRRLKRALRGTAIDCSAHSARKLYAVNTYQETEDVYSVQKALNHKYITTTATYLGINLPELIRHAMRDVRAEHATQSGQSADSSSQQT